jgi:hypothetical protein
MADAQAACQEPGILSKRCHSQRAVCSGRPAALGRHRGSSGTTIRPVSPIQQRR